jgi:hypothetical protein
MPLAKAMAAIADAMPRLRLPTTDREYPGVFTSVRRP